MMLPSDFDASSAGLTRLVLSITTLDELDDFIAHLDRIVARNNDPDQATTLEAARIILDCRDRLRALSATPTG